MVMASGIVTSRTSFSFGSAVAMTGHARWMRRRNDGDRMLAHLVGGERGDERQPAARLLRRVGAGRLGGRRRTCGAGPAPAPRRGRGASSSSSASSDRTRARRPQRWRRRRGVVVVSPPKRFLATSSALCLVSSSCLRRSSSSRLRASAASRSARSTASRCLRIARVLLGDLALFGLAQAGVAERVGAAADALPRSACAAPRRTAWAAGAGCGVGAGAAAGAAAPAACRRGWGQPGVARRGFGPVVLPGAPRLLDLLDDDRLGAAMAEALAHDARARRCALSASASWWGSRSASCRQSFPIVSAIPYPISRTLFSAVVSRPLWFPGQPVRKRSRRAKARQKRLAFGAGKQGCMYHI